LIHVPLKNYEIPDFFTIHKYHIILLFVLIIIFLNLSLDFSEYNFFLILGVISLFFNLMVKEKNKKKYKYLNDLIFIVSLSIIFYLVIELISNKISIFNFIVVIVFLTQICSLCFFSLSQDFSDETKLKFFGTILIGVSLLKNFYNRWGIYDSREIINSNIIIIFSFFIFCLHCKRHIKLSKRDILDVISYGLVIGSMPLILIFSSEYFGGNSDQWFFINSTMIVGISIIIIVNYKSNQNTTKINSKYILPALLSIYILVNMDGIFEPFEVRDHIWWGLGRYSTLGSNAIE